MVNPGSFKGPRKEFLLGEKPVYKAAVAGGYVGDTLAKIHRPFFKRFPVDMPVDVDPTPEELVAVDDNIPDEEDEAPDPIKMTPEEFEALSKAFKERQHLIQFRKAVSSTVVLCLAGD
jgi:hypothetical protein